LVRDCIAEFCYAKDLGTIYKKCCTGFSVGRYAGKDGQVDEENLWRFVVGIKCRRAVAEPEGVEKGETHERAVGCGPILL